MKHDEKIEAIIQNNPFIQMFARLKKGTKATECTEKMGALFEAVKRTGSKGKMTIELTVEPDDKGEVRTVDIKAKVTAKCPERKEPATTFFIVGERSLSTTGTIAEELELDFEARITPMPSAITKMPAQPTAAAGR